MKVGFIFECAIGGPDERVYSYLAKHFCSSITPMPLCKTNKKNLKDECANDVRILLKGGCKKVVIIWDKMPPWGGAADCKRDKADIKRKLKNEGMTNFKDIFLLCIDEELESWMISDGRAFSHYFQSFSTKRLVDFPDYKSKVQQKNAKSKIWKYNGKYNEFTDAIKVVKIFVEQGFGFDRIMKRNKSFNEFAHTIEVLCKAA